MAYVRGCHVGWSVLHRLAPDFDLCRNPSVVGLFCYCAGRNGKVKVLTVIWMGWLCYGGFDSVGKAVGALK